MKISDIAPGTPEKFNVVIETPRGSSNKYEYDEKLDCIVLDFVFHDDLSFIADYGFIPGTLAGDGDTLDAYVFTSSPLQPGIVVLCRAIGMIVMLDRGEVDNKILAVPISDPSPLYKSLNDLSETKRDEFKKFYTAVAQQKKKSMEIKDFVGEDQAMEEIRRSIIVTNETSRPVDP